MELPDQGARAGRDDGQGVSRHRRRELEAKIKAAESRAMEEVEAEHTRAAPKYKEPLR